MSKKNYCNNYKIGTNLIRNEQIENIMGSTKMYEKKAVKLWGRIAHSWIILHPTDHVLKHEGAL